MKRKKNDFYKNRRVLKTAIEGYDETLPNPQGGYHRQDEKKQIKEGLEEFADEQAEQLHIEIGL